MAGPGLGFQQGEFDQAIADLDRAVELEPLLASLYVHRGHVWEMKKEYDKAIADYSEAIRLDPNESTAYSGRAHAYAEQVENRKAIVDYSEAIRLNPRDIYALASRARLWILRNDLEKAEQDIKQALLVDPQSPDVLRLKSYVQDQKTQALKKQTEKTDPYETPIARLLKELDTGEKAK
jgi:tetratricopeptide (TPR) repeat protein